MLYHFTSSLLQQQPVKMAWQQANGLCGKWITLINILPGFVQNIL